MIFMKFHVFGEIRIFALFAKMRVHALSWGRAPRRGIPIPGAIPRSKKVGVRVEGVRGGRGGGVGTEAGR